MHIRVVKNFLSQFCFFTAGTVEKTVINNENIFSFLICQITNVIVDDVGCKKRSKTESVCFCRIKETVKSVLRKSFLKRAGPLLHIHTSSDKNVAEFVTKQRNRRNTFFLHSITSGKKLTDMMFGKKSLNTIT